MNTVRRAVVNARYERFAVRIGGPGASMKGQWPTLLLAAVLVFACFFVIGRLGAKGAPRGEASSALRAFSGRAAIPGGLRGDSPIAGGVPNAIAARRTAPSATATSAPITAASAQPLAERPSRTLAPSVAPRAAPVAQPAPAEAPAPAQQSPERSRPSSGQPSGSGGGSQPSSSSSGSFDSSE